MINEGFPELMKNIILKLRNIVLRRIGKTIFTPRYICAELWNPKTKRKI